MSILFVSSEGGFGTGAVIDTTGTGSVTASEIDFFSIEEAARLSTGLFCTLPVNVLGALTLYSWNGSTTAPVFSTSGTFAGGNVLPGYGLNINNDLFWGLLNLNVTDASFYKFNALGVVLNTVGPVTGVGLGALFCVNITETIAYYENNLTSKIKRWDLVNNIALADFVTFDTDYFVSGMWNVQGSTDIVVAYNNWSGPGDNTRVLIRYTVTGTIVYTSTYYTIPDPNEDDFSEVCLSADLLGMWSRDAGPPSYDMTVDCIYQHVLFADGSVDNTVNVPVTAGGSPDTTCFLMELDTTPDYSGIYHLPPTKTFDELFTLDVKIPDPTVRLFPLGE